MGRTDNPDGIAYSIGRAYPDKPFDSQSPWRTTVSTTIERVTVSDLADRIEAATEYWRKALEAIAALADEKFNSTRWMKKAMDAGWIAKNALDGRWTPPPLRYCQGQARRGSFTRKVK